MKCIFWNVNQNTDVNLTLAEMVEENEANLVVLAEYSGGERDLVERLRERGLYFFSHVRLGCDRISIFSDFSPERFLIRGSETSYYTIRELNLPSSLPILFSFVHFPSKLHHSETDQLYEATYLRREIEQVEEVSRNFYTAIVGDFNMNPFDKGMISASAFHSISSSAVAKRESRQVRGRSHRFFYNPTWSLLGDREQPPGTHYYGASGEDALFWHAIDQVILRPGLVDRFNKASFRVLTTAGQTSLLNENGHPTLSDHLPISFEIDISNGETRDKLVA